MLKWQGGPTKFHCKIKYNGKPANCLLSETTSGWKFAVYDEQDKYIVQYKFRNVDAAKAQEKAEYYINMEP